MIIKRWKYFWDLWINHNESYQQYLNYLNGLLGTQFDPSFAPSYLAGNYFDNPAEKIFICSLNPSSANGNENNAWTNMVNNFNAEHNNSLDFDWDIKSEFNFNCLIEGFIRHSNHAHYTNLGRFSFNRNENIPNGWERYKRMHQTLVLGEFFPFFSNGLNFNPQNLTQEGIDVISSYWTVLINFIQKYEFKYAILTIDSIINNEIVGNSIKLKSFQVGTTNIPIAGYNNHNFPIIKLNKTIGIITPFIGGHHKLQDRQGNDILDVLESFR